MRIFYLSAAVAGTVIPWLFFADFFSRFGLDLPLFLQSLFHNGAAGGFSADVLISLLIFWVWSYRDARNLALPHWWLVLPSSCLVGLSLSLPLYLFLREGHQR